jgi:hypothetical protein
LPVAAYGGTILFMDLSKLPKLSGNREANKPQESIPQNATGETEMPAAAAPVSIPYQARAIEPPAPGPDAFLSLAIGAVLMMVGRGFAEWLIATVRGVAYDTGVIWQAGPKIGQAVKYWELEGFTALSESTVFIFGLALVVDGIVLFIARAVPRMWTKLLFAAFLLTVLAAAANALAIVVLLVKDGPTPIWATLLAGLGAYTAWQQWRLLRYGASGM